MNSSEIKKLDKEKIVGTYSRYDMVADSGSGSDSYSQSEDQDATDSGLSFENALSDLDDIVMDF